MPAAVPPGLDAALPEPPAASAPGPMIRSVAARIALYMACWLAAYNLAAVPALLVGVILAFQKGRINQEVMDRLMKGDVAALLGWPLFGVMNWCILAATVGITWIVVRYIDREPIAAIGFGPLRWRALHWLLGFLLGGLFLDSIFLAGSAVGWYHVSRIEPAARAVPLLVSALVILLPAAAVEEITMRGYVLRVIEERYGWKRALLASSLIFAVLHALNPGFIKSPGALPGLLLAGVYLGSAYLLTHRLDFPIALHTAWNFFEGPVFGFKVSGLETPSVLHLRESGPALWTGGAFGPEAGILIPLALLLHLPLLWLAGRWLRSMEDGIRGRIQLLEEAPGTEPRA
jgi:membrane protease YdiL (CAAX protease family)